MSVAPPGSILIEVMSDAREGLEGGRYFYSTTWCSHCENHSPRRRRARSDSYECCKRKCKELKSGAVTKHFEPLETNENNQQYEFKEIRYECCRLRPNLVELPTSYIINQQPPETGSSGMEESKLLEHYHKTAFTDQPKKPLMLPSNYCPLKDDTQHTLSNYTDTYFNRPIEREKYCLEVDALRERLKGLQRNVYTTSSQDGPAKLEGNGQIKTKITLKPNRLIKSRKSRRPKIESAAAVLESPISSEFDSDSGDDEIEDVSQGQIDRTGAGDSGVIWPVRPSLFPNIPPYVKFNSHEEGKDLLRVPTMGKKYFKWKLSTITPVVVRKTLVNTGFALVRSEFTRESNQWLGTWGKHMKSPLFKTLKEGQKLNHFPGTFQLGRKDRLWRNFQKMITKFGHKEFGFLPHTYILPQEMKLLKQNWTDKHQQVKEVWIIKPPASARGVGIRVINKWSQLPKKTSLICQKYIPNPYLIDGSKFDLRLYVLVTSFHPLRIYLYPDGLARFASSKYSSEVKDLKDRYKHLTNYSINKLSSQYTANEDANACQGHKWTLSKLMEYMYNVEGVDTETLWRNLQQLVIKTIISSEALITPLCEENMSSNYNCYELFGIDVLLDEHLKPWLLEVNISPSLHSSSPLDAHVKGPLVTALLDLAQFHYPQRLHANIKSAPYCYDSRLYTVSLTKKERIKHCRFARIENRCDYLDSILQELTGDDVRHLVRAEDEMVARGQFERIFPTVQSHQYLRFMENRYYNRLFDAWETKYGTNRDEGVARLQELCKNKLHLKVGHRSTLNKSCQSLNPVPTSTTMGTQVNLLTTVTELATVKV